MSSHEWYGKRFGFTQTHGDALRRSYSPRRFASRHVPTAAEELAAQSHFLDPMIIKRFDGDLGAT